MHADDSRGNKVFLSPSVCLFFFGKGYQKPMQHKITCMLHDGYGKPFILGSRVTKKHCQRGSLHSCECWLLLVAIAILSCYVFL